MKLFARTGSRKSAAGRNKNRRRGWRWLFAFFLVALPLAFVVAVLAFYAVWAQTFDLKRVGTMPERNTVFDVNGKIYSRLAGANRLKVSLKEVSPLFIQALLAREDTRFYEHGGIDWRGVARALYRDIKSGSAREGASSITQQLARNSLPLGGRTVSRKLLEAMVALRIERELTKDQILELYVNRIYFGSGLLRGRNGIPILFWKKCLQARSLRVGPARRFDSQPEPLFAAQESAGLRGATRYGARSLAGVEKDHGHHRRSRRNARRSIRIRGVAP